jgi:hypothetical protein
MKKSVWLFMFFVSIAAASEFEPKIFRYTTEATQGNQVVSLQNYKFDDRLLIMRLPAGAASLESEDGDYIRLDLRGDSECRILLKFIPLAAAIPTEEQCLEIYKSEIKKAAPSLIVKGFRNDARLKPKIGSFHRSYLLAETPDSPVKEIHTFFIQPPYLYAVTLVSHSQILGKNISDCSMLLRSMQIEPRRAESTTAPVEEGSLTNIKLEVTPQEIPKE